MAYENLKLLRVICRTLKLGRMLRGYEKGEDSLNAYKNFMSSVLCKGYILCCDR